MPVRNAETKLQNIQKLARKFDDDLKHEFGAEHFSAGSCLLLGRYYGESDCIYFSLNPGFPRSDVTVDPVSPEGYNVPFHNPEILRKQYVYLRNCQRFFMAYPSLNEWVNQGVTSAFLVPWRTSNMSELRRLNRLTNGRLFSYAGRLVKHIIHDHQAKLLIMAGKSALDLMGNLGIIEQELPAAVPLGPGKSYQWSKHKPLLAGAEINILQIPHFSRANSPAKMHDLALWLMEELQPFGVGGRTEPADRKSYTRE